MTPLARGKNDMDFLVTRVPQWLLILNMFLSLAYLFTISFLMDISNPWMFGFLLASQLFFTWLGLAHIHTLWNMEHAPTPPRKRGWELPSVDVFITVAGEPIDIVRRTAHAACSMRYAGTLEVYLLNDGLVAKKDNWQEIEALAHELGVGCITRTIHGGAKAGNINNALKETTGDIVVIFDADHVPHKDFLHKTVPWFADPRMGFVQTPQYYSNSLENAVTLGAWEQQMLFYGSICKGKNRYNAATMCGTNMLIRREALVSVGGIETNNIAEDFITGMYIHEAGWKSVYVPEVLAEGLAPEDFLSYYKQQYRWARGSLDLLFRSFPLFRRGLTGGQKIQYLASASYYLSGFFVLSNALMPLFYFYSGQSIFTTSTMVLAAAFMPYIFLTLYNLQRSCNYTYTFRALAFSMGSFSIHIQALFSTILGNKQSFSITSKRKIEGRFTELVMPHLVYVAATFIGILYALFREGLTPSLVTNVMWALLNVSIFAIVIRAALGKTAVTTSSPVPEPAFRRSTFGNPAIARSYE